MKRLIWILLVLGALVGAGWYCHKLLQLGMILLLCLLLALRSGYWLYCAVEKKELLSQWAL